MLGYLKRIRETENPGPGLLYGSAVFFLLGFWHIVRTDFIPPWDSRLWQLVGEHVAPFFRIPAKEPATQLNVFYELKFLFLSSGFTSGLVIGAMSTHSYRGALLGALPGFSFALFNIA